MLLKSSNACNHNSICYIIVSHNIWYFHKNEMNLKVKYFYTNSRSVHFSFAQNQGGLRG